MGSGNNNLYEFDEFRFDSEKHRLWQNNELILLSPKASELLKCLLEREGEFVSKAEIFDCVWADTFVEDGVLTQNIYTLRKALGTDKKGSPIIENKTRLGYRIAVPVKVLANGIHKSGTNGDVRKDSIDEIVFTDEFRTPSTNKTRNSKKLGIALILGAVLLATSAFLGYRLFRPRVAAFFRKPIETVKFQSLTDTGNIWHPALSPDGNFAAFIRERKMYLKDLASNKEIKLEIPNVSSFSALQFSADGKFIYFRPINAFRKDADILKVSRFGGETRIVAEKSWGSFAVSNDGKQIAFVRNIADQAKQFLMIKNLETGAERELATVDFPELFLFNSAPAWSPDNRKIAFVVQNFPARRTVLFEIDAEDGGQKEEIKLARLRQIEQVAWLPDGETLVALASEGGKFYHLWKVFYADGDAQRITNGLNTYGKIAVSADGKKILALQIAESSNIFVANQDNLNEQKQITFGNSNNVGQMSLEWADENKLVYVAYSEENPMANLWTVNTSDNSRQPLTANTDFHTNSPTVSGDGKFIYFTTTQSPVVNVWRMGANGNNLTQITDGKDGFRMFPQISPDGKFLYYIFRNREGGSIRRFNLAENKEEILLEKGAANPVASLSLALDGSRMIFINWINKVGEEDDKTNFQLGVVSTQNPGDVRFFDVKLLSASIQMTPDGKAFDYMSWAEGKTMILRQHIEGGEPQEIFTLSKTRLFNFAWSKSRKQLALSYGHQNKDAVLLTEFDK